MWFSSLCVVCQVVAMLLSGPDPASTAGLRVGENIRVSADRSDWTLGESFAAADPANAEHLIVCTTARSPGIPSTQSSLFYVSFDRGASWISTLDVPRTTDPSCGFGNGGVAYAATLNELGIKFFRSDDGGKTWQPPAALGSGFDREQLMADRRKRSPFGGRIYVDAMSERVDSAGKSHGDHIVMLYSADGGRTFHEKVGIPLSNTDNFTGIFPGTMAILSDGTVIVLYRDRLPGKLIQITESSDGGDHLTAPITVAEGIPCDEHGLGQNPQIAVDETDGPFQDRLYAVWPDESAGWCQTMFAYSADRGKSWSEPVVVGDNRPFGAFDRQGNDILPAVAVNNTGVVGVSWYAAAQDHRNGFGLRFAASLDGGESFPSIVSPSPVGYSPSQDAKKDLRVVAHVDEQGKIETFLRSRSGWPGDTQALTADAAAVFHAFWYDNRTGLLQLWSAPITIGEPAYRNGARELATFDDVTSDISLDYSSVQYDPLTNSVSLDLTLRNKSIAPIYGPIMARVLRLSCPKGELEVVGSANEIVGPGAVWDWTPALADGVLRPSQSSRPLKLTLRIRGGTSALSDLTDARFDVRVLGRHKPN